MSFFRRLIAVFDPRRYGALLRAPAHGFGFMAGMLALAMAISMVVTTLQTRRNLEQAVADMEKGRSFSLANGHLRMDGPMPVVYGGRDGEPALIIDTSNKINPAVLAQQPPKSMLVTSDYFYQENGSKGLQQVALRDLPFTADRDGVIRIVRQLYLAIPVSYVFLYMFQLGFKVVDAVVLAALALLVGKLSKWSFDFSTAWRAGLYALTVSTVLQWAVPTMSSLSLRGFFIWWAIALAYQLIGLRYYARENPPADAPPPYASPPVYPV